MSIILVRQDHWCPILESHELGSRPLDVEKFTRRLVYWRNAGGWPLVHSDRCPDLGASFYGCNVSQVKGTKTLRILRYLNKLTEVLLRS